MPADCLRTQPPPPSRKGHAKGKTALGQAIELQRLLFQAAQKDAIRPAELSGVSRAFVELEECKRKLRMRPLPKAVDVTQLKRKSKAIDSGIDAS